MPAQLQIKLPSSITGTTVGNQAKGKKHRHDHAVRDLQPTHRTTLSRRPTAAPRRSSY